MQYANAQILIFAKSPVAGQVKTRLAETIGSEQACKVYEALLTRTLDTALSAQLAPVCCYTDDTEHAYFKRWKQKGVLFKQQVGADLGQRMQQAFIHELKLYAPVVLIGSDCPVITVEHLSAACHALDGDTEAVITPTLDGGYVLLGLKKLHPKIFSNIQWSSKHVFRQTVEHLDSLSLKWQQLNTLWDLDTAEDHQKWLSTVSQDTTHA